MSMNYVDLILVAVIVLGMFRSWQRGFLLATLELIGWISSWLLAFRYHQPVALWLGPRVGWPDVYNAPAAFLLTAIVAGAAINIVGLVVLRKVPMRTHHHKTNRQLGIVPGFVNGVISAAILSTLLLTLPLPSTIPTATQESAIANRLANYTEQVQAALLPIFGDAISQTLNMITIAPESDETVELPFTVTGGKPRPELEAEMLELINAERVEVGLAPLGADLELTIVARQHSVDMFARGYFAHTTPEGRSPFDRISAADIPFLTAGENLALAPTLRIAHTGLMNSPGHRANILRPEFGRVGIGIIDGGARGLMVTQNFRN